MILSSGGAGPANTRELGGVLLPARQIFAVERGQRFVRACPRKNLHQRYRSFEEAGQPIGGDINVEPPA
jgi:hypothetical protein